MTLYLNDSIVSKDVAMHQIADKQQNFFIADSYHDMYYLVENLFTEILDDVVDNYDKEIESFTEDDYKQVVTETLKRNGVLTKFHDLDLNQEYNDFLSDDNVHRSYQEQKVLDFIKQSDDKSVVKMICINYMLKQLDARDSTFNWQDVMAADL